MVVAEKRRVGRPTRMDAMRKSERLLDAATELFVLRGFEGTTMEAIALAADMGKQAVYMRFPDKESVLMAVIQRLKDTSDLTLPPVVKDLPFAAGFAQRIQQTMSISLSPRSRLICQLSMREGHRFPALRELLSDATAERFTGPLAALIDEAKARGEVRRDAHSLLAASMIVDLVYSEGTRASLQQRTPSASEIKERAEQIAALLLSGLAAHR